jgi:hypothetical protein
LDADEDKDERTTGAGAGTSAVVVAARLIVGPTAHAAVEGRTDTSPRVRGIVEEGPLGRRSPPCFRVSADQFLSPRITTRRVRGVEDSAFVFSKMNEDEDLDV